jgi:hypothetical protein
MAARAPAGHVASCLAALTLFLAVGVDAAPSPQKPGWVVRLVASGFGLNFNGLVYDPVTTDLFTTDFNNKSVYRVTQTGVVTQIYNASGTGFDCDEMTFDPASRTLFFGGVGQTTLRHITEFGAFIEDIAVSDPYTGLAMGPGGYVYMNLDASSAILRYNPVTHVFTTFASGLSAATLEGLSFDTAGYAYVCDYGSGRQLRVAPPNLATTIGTVPSPIGSAWGGGVMYVTDYGGGNIWCVADDGSGTSLFATGHSGTSGIVVANNGNIYVNEHDAGRIWEYSMQPVAARPLSWGALKSRYR